MAVYDNDRTQVWVLRTQELKRSPAIRGGLVPDLRARRQSALGVVGVFLVLLLLALLPIAPGRQEIVDRESDSPLLAPLTSRAAAVAPPATPVLPPARFLPQSVSYLEWVPMIGVPSESVTWRDQRAAPFAPIWLDTHPRDSSDVTSGTVPGATLPQPAGAR